MFALAYASHTNCEFDCMALKDLADHATNKNHGLNITGYLCFNRGIFFQYLEGEKQAVLGLMAEIEADERHTVTNVVYLGEIEERLFPEWSMRFLQVNELSGIQLEHVLERVLLTMRESVFGEAVVRDTVFRLVSKIATFQKSFPEYGTNVLNGNQASSK